MALVQAGHPVFAVIAVLASVLTLWYYLILQRKAFFGKLNEKWAAVKEAPFWMTAATVLLALLCVGDRHSLLVDRHDLDPARRRRARGRGPRRDRIVGILDDDPANRSSHRRGALLGPGHPAQGPAQVGHLPGRGQPAPGHHLLPDGRAVRRRLRDLRRRRADHGPLHPDHRPDHRRATRSANPGWPTGSSRCSSSSSSSSTPWS